jgi:hypothetical protein
MWQSKRKNKQVLWNKMAERGSKEARRKGNFHIYLSTEGFYEIEKKNCIEPGRDVGKKYIFH